MFLWLSNYLAVSEVILLFFPLFPLAKVIMYWRWIGGSNVTFRFCKWMDASPILMFIDMRVTWGGRWWCFPLPTWGAKCPWKICSGSRDERRGVGKEAGVWEWDLRRWVPVDPSLLSHTINEPAHISKPSSVGGTWLNYWLWFVVWLYPNTPAPGPLPWTIKAL